MFDGSDHLAVLAKLKMKKKWVYEKKGGVKREIVKIEKLQEKEIQRGKRAGAKRCKFVLVAVYKQREAEKS